MAITRFRNSSIRNRTPKYNDVLAGLPFRPIIGTASDGGNGTSASVAFTGNNPGGAGVTYTALSSPGSFTGTGTASPITVSGLTAGTAYTFQVKAGNSLGDSAYSAASNSVTPVTPTAFESIATVTGTGSSNTITFSSIPGTYQHLQIRAVMKSNGTSTDPTNVNITFNGSSATNYASHRLQGYGTGVLADGLSAQPNIRLTRLSLNNDASQANMVGVAIIDIHDYASTTKAKTVRSFYGNDVNAANFLMGATLHSGLWTLTNAITSITFTLAANNFTNQTQFALYGIKGA